MTKLSTTLLRDLPIKQTSITDEDYVVVSSGGTKKLKVKDITKGVEKKAADLEVKTTELRSDLDNKANESDVKTLETRINTFTNLPEGSTAGDAELSDGRIGADGVARINIGSSIRESLKKIVDFPTNYYTGGNVSINYNYGNSWKYKDVEVSGLIPNTNYYITIGNAIKHLNQSYIAQVLCKNNDSVLSTTNVTAINVKTPFSIPEQTTLVIIRFQAITSTPATETGTAFYSDIVINEKFKEDIYLSENVKIKKMDSQIEKFNNILSNTLGSSPITNSKTTLNNAEYMTLEDNNIKKNKQLSFYSKINSFTKVKLGHGETVYNANYIEIDNTNLYVYSYISSTNLIGTYAHGLTISDFIGVVIDVNSSGLATIRISSKTGIFKKDNITWIGSRGNIFVSSINSTLSDCKLTWNCTDYKKNIYAFGDSYFEMNSPNMWTYYINQWGYDNWLVDSYSGRNSVNALKSLKLALTHGTPKYILWCLGMNDPDSSSTINSDWKNTIEEVKKICTDKGIELVLTTIPNVNGNGAPRNHNFKNEYVKNSGYRYIDFNKAVGADISNNWYEGMLWSDGVHPLPLGGQTLAIKALCDFPELMQK